MAELTPVVPGDVLADAARQVALIHLDRAWADYLAYLAEVRESVHLRVLARGVDPLSEFHKEAIRAFTSLLDDVAYRSAKTFRIVPITADGADAPPAGLKRLTGTWTYLVHDNPFGTDIDRAIRSVGRWLRAKIR